MRNWVFPSPITMTKDKLKYKLSLAMPFALIGFCLLSCTGATQNETDQLIGSSKTLTYLDNLCNELPRPAGFRYVYKKVSGNSFTHSVSYQFESEISFGLVRDHFVAYLESNGWTREFLWEENGDFHNGQFKYNKGKDSIWLEHVAFQNANYSIGCSQVSK